MSLTPREAFKYGFLARCLENGQDLAGAHAQVKVALDKLASLGSIISSPLDTGWSALKDMGTAAWALGVPAALAAPPLVGGALGYGASKLTDVDDRDVKTIKNDELEDEYRRQTALLRRVKQMRDAKLARKRSGRMYM